MSTKHLLAIVTAVLAGAILASCRNHNDTNPSLNIFYDQTRQADSFGFSDATFQQLQAAFRQQKPTDFKSAFYYYEYGCGYYHINKRDEYAALKYADSMLMVVKKKGWRASDQREIAIANLSKGDILFSLQRYNEACDYYYWGKIAAEKSGDGYTLSEYSYRLGMAMYHKANYLAAARYFKNAFEESEPPKHNFADFYRRQEVLDNAALSYLYAHQPDSAVWYANKGLAYVKENESRYGSNKRKLMAVANGVLYGTLGRAYLQLRNAAGAAFLQKSIAINAAPGGDHTDALQIQNELAQYYLDSAFGIQLPQAHAVLQAVAHGLDTLHNQDAAIGWNKLMSVYHALLGNKSEAYTYLSRHEALLAQQQAANINLDETNISSRLKEMQDRYELSLLQSRSKLNTIYLLIAVMLCILSAIILFLIVRNWKKEKKNSGALASLNKHVRQQKLQLEVMIKELDQQIKAKDYILRVVAHDLRNPISAISTLTRIVSEEYENEEENKEFLEMAQSACKDSLAMIDSIMQLSQDGKVEKYDKRIFNVNETVLDWVEMARLKAGEKQQQIVLHMAATPQYILADAEKIGRVINNLLTNAIKFSFPNSTIEVSINDRGDDVEIAVKDEGIGIPADLQGKVFDVFTEAKRKGTSKEVTFGLGLSICKQLIEAHSGKIWLESKEGLGSTFFIQLHKHNTQDESMLQYEAEEVM